MKHEYHEGPEAAEKFEKMAIRIFRAPKSTAKPVAKRTSVRKAKKTSKGLCLRLPRPCRRLVRGGAASAACESRIGQPLSSNVSRCQFKAA